MTRFSYEVLQTDGPLAGTWVSQTFETPDPDIYRDTFTTQIHAGEVRNVREVDETPAPDCKRDGHHWEYCYGGSYCRHCGIDIPRPMGRDY